MAVLNPHLCAYYLVSRVFARDAGTIGCLLESERKGTEGDSLMEKGADVALGKESRMCRHRGWREPATFQSNEQHGRAGVLEAELGREMPLSLGDPEGRQITRGSWLSRLAIYSSSSV